LRFEQARKKKKSASHVGTKKRGLEGGGTGRDRIARTWAMVATRVPPPFSHTDTHTRTYTFHQD
jgi:hypothetical protein